MDKAEFLYNNEAGFAVEHNYLCAVCLKKSAVLQMNEWKLLPCWECQKQGYALVKLGAMGKIFIKQVGEI